MEQESVTPLQTAIVGLGGIAKQHIQAIADDPAFALTAVCDLDPNRLHQRVTETGAQGFADIDEMLREARPEVVIVATENSSHAPLTLRCSECECVRAIHCEKPMAVHPDDARAMVAACEEKGILLTINHQRRMGDLAEARAYLCSGKTGVPVEVRGFCAGDLLSDGTHLIDGLLALMGDPPVHSIDASMRIEDKPGQRYGHAVEVAAMVSLEIRNGPLCRLLTGAWAKGHAYQEMHLLCEHAQLWRTGDRFRPNWFVSDGSEGDHIAAFDRENWMPRPLPVSEKGSWRAAPFAQEKSAPAAVFAAIEESLRTGAPHPLNGRRTLQVQTILCGAYFSALRERPVSWEEAAGLTAFPLAGDNATRPTS